MPCSVPNCPVNGIWSVWSTWTLYPKNCVVGNETRTRSCNNPTPAHGGDNCTGDDREFRINNNNNCSSKKFYF